LEHVLPVVVCVLFPDIPKEEVVDFLEDINTGDVDRTILFGFDIFHFDFYLIPGFWKILYIHNISIYRFQEILAKRVSINKNNDNQVGLYDFERAFCLAQIQAGVLREGQPVSIGFVDEHDPQAVKR